MSTENAYSQRVEKKAGSKFAFCYFVSLLD